MKVLLLGARGLLGEWLAQVFGDQELVAWDKAELDITDESLVRSKIISCQPDLVINAAAYTEVDAAEKKRELAYAINEAGVRNIAQTVKDLGTTMVHFSTDYVFDGQKKNGYAENDPPGPAVNAYGESKLAGERALKEINPKFYLIRTAWLYGPKTSGQHKNFVDTVVKLGLEKVKAEKKGSGAAVLRVVNDQFGNPTYAGDLARATRQLATGDFPPGIYHLTNSGVATWHELAIKIFTLVNLPVTVIPVSAREYPRPAIRPEYSILHNMRGPKLRPWPEALEEYLNVY